MLQVTSQFDFAQPPPVMGQFIHQRIRQLCGNSDPYRESELARRLAADLLPRCSPARCRAADPWEMAVQLAIVGNVMDLGVKSGLTEQVGTPSTAHRRSARRLASAFRKAIATGC